MFRRGCFGRQVLGVFGCAGLAARLRSSCLPITSLGRDRPSRFILPITALRVTPISRAIWLHDSPALKWRLSSSTRSESQDWRIEVARLAGMILAPAVCELLFAHAR